MRHRTQSTLWAIALKTAGNRAKGPSGGSEHAPSSAGSAFRSKSLHQSIHAFSAGEESLTIFVDKRKLSRKAETAGSFPAAGGSGNSSAVSLETLHQLAASYFIDRESTLRRLHHIQIATGAIKVMASQVWVWGQVRAFTSSRSARSDCSKRLRNKTKTFSKGIISSCQAGMGHSFYNKYTWNM